MRPVALKLANKSAMRCGDFKIRTVMIDKVWGPGDTWAGWRSERSDVAAALPQFAVRWFGASDVDDLV